MTPHDSAEKNRKSRKKSNYYNRIQYRTEKKFSIPLSSMFLWKAMARAMRVSVNAFVVAACDEAAEAFMNEMHGRKETDWISRVEHEMDKSRKVTDCDPPLPPPLPDVQFLNRLGRETESRSRPLRPVDDQDSDGSVE